MTTMAEFQHIRLSPEHPRVHLARKGLRATYGGPIHEGMELDHLCRNRSCVNPSHLQPVSRSINNLRGTCGEYQRAKTHCPQGHPYDLLNTRFYRGNRYCRVCLRVADRKYKAQKRAGLQK